MELGLQLGYWQRAPFPKAVEAAQEAENLGYSTVWTGESYSSDSFTPLAWVGAHTSKIQLGTSVTQVSARSPASAAMSALSLDYLSGGRFIMGIGVSGPQIVEGWYGQPFGKPLTRTREWVDIFNKIIAREEPVSYDGECYQLPYKGPGAWGLGKPLKSITHPLRSKIPIFIGAEGPKNVAQTFEIADGWLPLFMSPYSWELYEDVLAKRGEDFKIIMPSISIHIVDDLAAALLPVKYILALYIGGMGAKDRNFHKELVARMGYADEAQQIQDLYLAGKKEEAMMAVPDKLADEISLCGPKERIKERLEEWKKTPLDQLAIGYNGNHEEDISAMRFFAENVL